jgi:riboflavin biosynthesis pyrimidine reductase
MQHDVLELYPNPGRQHTLKNLYLDELAELPAAQSEPFIYSNFIASLDGRIALPGEHRHSHQVPPAITNPRDWRLFQELATQADLLISSARYFRQAADAEAQAELPVGLSAEFDDLRDWRQKNGMTPQPDIAVFSASLDIPAETLEYYSDRRVFVLTGAHADAVKRQQLASIAHVEIISCGEGRRVDAHLLRALLGQLGYRRVYAIAGSSVLHTLVSGNALDRLYHTTAHCVLGGTEFDTFVWGEQLQPAFALPLRTLYLDTSSPPGCGQTLAVYGN